MSFNQQTRLLGCISPQKKEHTTTKVFSGVEKRELRSVKHTQGEVREQISTMITALKSRVQRGGNIRSTRCQGVSLASMHD